VTTNNQLTGDTYDAAGNLMTIPGTGGATYVYNAENQMTSTSNSSTGYVYDGDGNRVEKTGSKIYWYAGGEILDETDTTGSVTNSSFNEYYFFGGMRVARRDSSSNVFYYLVDQLDSSRVIAEVPSGQSTATLCYDADFEPYGGEHSYTNTCPQNYKFTSKERDTESGLDNFGARYYASTTGRFMSPDWALRPIAVPYATFGDPQTLNLYTYVENSPLNRIDADGHAGTQGGIGAQSGDACSGVGLVCDRDAGGGRLTDDTFGSMSAGEARTVDGNPAQFDVAQNTASDKPAPQPAPTDPQTGKPTPPPVPVPGAPEGTGWKWNPNDQNPRGGTWGPDKWKGPNPPNGSWDPAGHWDINRGKGEPVDHYDPKGNPITPGTAHPGNAPTTMMDRMRAITPGPVLKWGTTGVVIYILIDEGSRLYLPRNLVPVP
jgi:RHS repeat-associated protein